MIKVRSVPQTYLVATANGIKIPSSKRADRAISDNTKPLQQQLQQVGLTLGQPIFIRIFKQSATLELWVKSTNNQYKLFKEYPICTFSGDLGPKLAEGDKQSPEGFYSVKPQQLNPASRFHLSFNLGYPNRYDRAHGRTGSALMVHGNCVSIGCYAMTDALIEEIYTLAYAAFSHGQPHIKVHAFPFKLTQQNLKLQQTNHWYNFWVNLKQGYDHFEKTKIPPQTSVDNLLYRFTD